MGRGPTTVVYLISSSAITEDDTDADASWSGGRRVLGPSRGVGVPAMRWSGGGGGPPRADRSKKRRAPRGGGDGTSWGGRRIESADTASQLARSVTSRGGGEKSRRHTWWGSETGVCVGAHGEGSGLRASRGCGGRETPERAGHNATRGWGEPDPVRGPISTTPLWRGSGGGRGGGCGRHAVRGPGRTPLLVVVAGRAGTPRHATRGLCSGRGVPRLDGARPLSCGQHTPGAAPKYPDPGQQGNDLSEFQGDRIWSGAGFFPLRFPNLPTTCLNFSHWRDLFAWRTWGGHFSRWRSGWGGVY